MAFWGVLCICSDKCRIALKRFKDGYILRFGFYGLYLSVIVFVILLVAFLKAVLSVIF